MDFKWCEALANSVHVGDVGWSVPRRNGHVWGCHVCLVPLLLIFCLSGSQINQLPVVMETFIPPLQLIYVRFD